MVAIDRSRDRFRVNFVGRCFNLERQLGIRFETRGTGRLSCVARGDTVVFRERIGPGRCRIRDVEFQTPEMDQQDAAAASQTRQR
jgi:hypothetical protein